MNGILSINKPQDMTSHDVVSFIRKKTGIKQVGHSGTLDPMATGVLPVFIGKATRIIEYASIPCDPEAKIYRCRMKLGIETDTLDVWGKTIDSKCLELFPDKEEVEKVLKGFEGKGTQRPPMYSAVKLEGRKLYEYARKGLPVDEEKIRERQVYIKHINVIRLLQESGEVEFDVFCSKGVYIRVLCSDAGRKLGTGAAMSALERLKSDYFRIEDSVPFESIREGDIPVSSLIDADVPLGWMPGYVLNKDEADRFVMGQRILIGEAAPVSGVSGKKTESLRRVYGPEGFIGTGIAAEGKLKPDKVLI